MKHDKDCAYHCDQNEWECNRGCAARISKYKLVPVEPTDEMIEAGLQAWTNIREVYAAMLTAAPVASNKIPNEPTVAMMDAGQDYLNERAPNGCFVLPATFRWCEFWDALLLAAAPSPAEGGRMVTEDEKGTFVFDAWVGWPERSTPTAQVNAEMLAALRECADDLEASVNGEYSAYHDKDGKIHPAMVRRFERDMGPVRNARAAIARAEQMQGDQWRDIAEVTAYAERLAVGLWEKHWRDAAPGWKPLAGDLIGLLTQIDNMTVGLSKDGQQK